ncbi:MAG: carboxymuconolactone decarboxylase family protein [Micavibrio aeruginosavorus]|uniref:Alkyl hydroperoxide reductase AhpD n=1 Tax=Micavibrio aeruginosavorus TaxID=349221 RepID=A0A7T5R3N2_9BACT|nr:MAG: carboxymuconolactone decarboxylase family protein [Micavibrio aeruginosavorus]
MSIDSLKEALPEYARDIKLNLSTLAGEELLTEQQKWGAFLSCALAGGNEFVIQALHAEASARLGPDALNAAKAAAAIMAMNNVYYKFTGMIENAEYRTMPARLRMNVIANPGVDKLDFELWSLAVSAVNGCQFCVNAHEPILIKGGLSKEQVQTAVRIAAVVTAASCVLNGEAALQGASAIVASAA